jgi:hypothetical protein
VVLVFDGTGEFFGLDFENPDVLVSGWKQMQDSVNVALVGQ